MSYDTVRYEVEGPVATIVLNRPDKLNAFNHQLISDFDAALAQAGNDASIRVVIIKGAGRAFSVGMDLDPGSHAPDKSGLVEDRERLQRSIERWLRVWEF